MADIPETPLTAPAGPANATAAAPIQPAPLATPDFTDETAGQELEELSLLDDVELEVSIELGRTQMYIEDVLRLGVGSVVELDKLAGDPVDVLVNGRLVARGEVLVLNDCLCVRVSEIVNPVPDTEAVA